jgi:hypothetical protein
MKLKRFIASIVATALVGTTVAMTSALDASAVADTYTATLQGQLVDTGFWNGDASTVQVTGDGSYSVSLTYNGVDAEVTSESCCLILTLDFNVYDVSTNGVLSETGIVIDINSVDCDGTSLNYSGTSSNDKAYRVDDDGKSIRHNIFNSWGGAAQDVSDITVPFSVTSGSVVTVNFTVSGLNDAITKAKELAGEDTSDSSDDNTNTDGTTNSDGSSDTTTTSAATTTSADTTTTGASTTKSDSDSNSDSDSDSGEVAQEETANATSDSGVAGIVLVCALAGAGLVATRKRD